MVERLLLVVPRDCLWLVIEVFPDHTHLLFLSSEKSQIALFSKTAAINMIRSIDAL